MGLTAPPHPPRGILAAPSPSGGPPAMGPHHPGRPALPASAQTRPERSRAHPRRPPKLTWGGSGPVPARPALLLHGPEARGRRAWQPGLFPPREGGKG